MVSIRPPPLPFSTPLSIAREERKYTAQEEEDPYWTL